MEAYQERVVSEKADLDEKIEKLKSFIAGEPFHLLPIKDQRLLALQSHIMQAYSSVLGMRISRFLETEAQANDNQ